MKQLLVHLIHLLGGSLKGSISESIATSAEGTIRALKLHEVIPYVNSALLESLEHELTDVYEFLFEILANIIEIKKQVESIRNTNSISDKSASSKLQNIYELVDNMVLYMYSLLGIPHAGTINSSGGNSLGNSNIGALDQPNHSKSSALVDVEIIEEMKTTLKAKLVVLDSLLSSKSLSNPKIQSKRLSVFISTCRDLSISLASLLDTQVVDAANISIFDFIKNVRQVLHFQCYGLMKCFASLPDLQLLSKELISKYNSAERLFQRYKMTTHVDPQASDISRHSNVLFTVTKLKEEISGIEEIASSKLDPVLEMLRTLTEFNEDKNMFTLRAQYQAGDSGRLPHEMSEISVNPWIERLSNLILKGSGLIQDILLNCNRSIEKEFITSWAMLQAILRQTNYARSLPSTPATSPKMTNSSSPSSSPSLVASTLASMRPIKSLNASDQAIVEAFDSEYFIALSRDWYSRIIKLDIVYRSSEFQSQYASLQTSRHLFQESLQFLKIAIVNFLRALKQFQDLKAEMARLRQMVEKGLVQIGFTNVTLHESFISTTNYDLDALTLKKIERLLESPLCSALLSI